MKNILFVAALPLMSAQVQAPPRFFRVQTTTLTVVANTELRAGSTAMLSLELHEVAERPAGLIWKLLPPAGAIMVGAFADPSVLVAGKSLICSQSTHKCILFGVNRTTMGEGTVAHVQVRLGAEYRGGDFQLTELSASTAGGTEIPMEAGPSRPPRSILSR